MGCIKLFVGKLFHKDYFYSSVTEEQVSENNNKHVVDVWTWFERHHDCEYRDVYLNTGMLLRADLFENFRYTCLNNYNLDSAHSLGLLSMQTLKYTKVKLELIN